MTTKRYTWKEEYATNGELFWKDLRENERKYAEEHEESAEQVEEELIEEDPRINAAERLGFGHIEINSEEERRQYMKSLLGVKE